MDIFEEVKSRLNIRQVVEYYGFKINRAGQFNCPFHSDKHPSASIKNDYFNCFVCGAGGDLIKFTATLYKLSNYEAAKKLINDFNLNIEIDKPVRISRLRADREYNKRLMAQLTKDDLVNEIEKTGKILTNYHFILWQGLQLSFESDANTEALQELPTIQYFLDCYEEQPEQFTIKYRKKVREYERRIYRYIYKLYNS